MGVPLQSKRGLVLRGGMGVEGVVASSLTGLEINGNPLTKRIVIFNVWLLNMRPNNPT